MQSYTTTLLELCKSVHGIDWMASDVYSKLMPTADSISRLNVSILAIPLRYAIAGWTNDDGCVVHSTSALSSQLTFELLAAAAVKVRGAIAEGII
jgi:hypothetical protein